MPRSEGGQSLLAKGTAEDAGVGGEGVGTSGGALGGEGFSLRPGFLTHPLCSPTAQLQGPAEPELLLCHRDGPQHGICQPPGADLGGKAAFPSTPR